MENAERFLTSLERLPLVDQNNLQELPPRHIPRWDRDLSVRRSRHEASPELYESQHQSKFVSEDVQLDDFDVEILAEDRQLQQWRIARTSKPYTPPASEVLTRLPREVSQSNIQFDQSPPRFNLASSPIVSVLQNRQRSYNGDANRRDSGHKLKGKYQPVRVKNTRERDISAKKSSSASHIPPIIKGITLVPTTELPDQFRSIFKFNIFNAVQSKCYSSVFKENENLVLSAPTGSGKTVVMELAICRLMSTSKNDEYKIVYQAPTKSLCSERYRDWQSKFGVQGLQCAELTGDTDYGHLQNVQSARIIITTPEKWDCVTRKWRDHARLMSMVKLFLIDEVHILKDPRGASLEAVVSRMKSVGSDVRFIALSATVPNSEDVALWLGRNPTSQDLPARMEVFGDDFRPVKLEKFVYGFRCSSNDFAFDTILTKCLPDIILKHGARKPVMIFCSTRSASISTAKALAQRWKTTITDQQMWNGPKRAISVKNSDLAAKESLSAAVAFHHGGLDAVDRRAVEDGFLGGDVKIICCTSTLAVGVNLPCYLVILKGTTSYTDNGLQEYSDLEIMQMLGRAGRPQFETSACAVILTRQEKVVQYEKMVAGQDPLESCLHENLIEHLNAEIGLGTVYDLPSAKRWLQGTFLHTRLIRNPSYYQFRENVNASGKDEIVQQLCEKDIKLLADTGLIESEGRLRCTDFGHTMARYYVRFDTTKSFISLPPKAKISEILAILSQATEFREVRMKAGEKSFYKEMNKANGIRFPIKVDVALQAHKVSLIIQAQLGGVSMPDSEIHKKHHQQHRVDKSLVFAHTNRLMRCLIDCLLNLGDAVAVRNALELSRSLAAQGWDHTAGQLRQIEGIGEVAARKLASAGISSIFALSNTEAQRIELIMGKAPPFGSKLLQSLDKFPQLRVSVQEVSAKALSGKGTELKFRVELGFLNKAVINYFKKRPIYVCFLSETSDGKLLEFRRFNAKSLRNGEDVLLTAILTRPITHITCHVMCDEVAGTHTYAELKLDHVKIPKLRLEKDFKPRPKTYQAQPASVSCIPDNDLFDEGLDDQDLLAADPDAKKTGVVQDIDDIVCDDSSSDRAKCSEQHLDRGSTQNYVTQDMESSEYREPFRLRNGRWTCQHDCQQRMKKCKHKCCQEGVIKPKRRPNHGTGAAERNARISDFTQPKRQKISEQHLERVNGDERTDFDPKTHALTNWFASMSESSRLNTQKANADHKSHGSQLIADETQSEDNQDLAYPVFQVSELLTAQPVGMASNVSQDFSMSPLKQMIKLGASNTNDDHENKTFDRLYSELESSHAEGEICGHEAAYGNEADPAFDDVLPMSVLDEVIQFEDSQVEGNERSQAYEEDQKEMWKDIEPWLYEQFHEFVELH